MNPTSERLREEPANTAERLREEPANTAERLREEPTEQPADASRPAPGGLRRAQWLHGPWLRAACVALTAAACALLGPQAAAGSPLSIDSTGFPSIRVYLPEGETAPALLTEDGRPVAMQRVSGAGERPPLVAALVLDTSGSMDAALPQLKAAADALVNRLGAADRMALVRFSSAVEVLLPPTPDRPALADRIATLRADGATALYDAVWAGVGQVQSAPGAGLRAVILLTDGKDEGEGPRGTPGSAMRLEPLRQKLLAARIPVFILGLGNEVERDVLDALAAASGGRAFYADDAGGIPGLLDTVARTLTAVREIRYISPRPALDGSPRIVEGSVAGRAEWRLTYTAPTDAELLWRWPVSGQAARAGERRRAMCGVGALSSAGTWALAFAPLTLLHGDGSPAGTLADVPPFRSERARMLEDGSGLLFGGTASASFSVDTNGAPQALARTGLLDPRASARNWVAVSPGGSAALRFLPAGSGAPARIEAIRAVTGTPLWSVPCPGSACDRLAGAAVSDDGAALINQTGALYRIAVDGTLSPARPEVFFGPVSLSADGRRAAAVVWQGMGGTVPGASRHAPGGNPGGSRHAPGIGTPSALLLDEALRPVVTLPVQAADADVPPVAALSPNGLFLAVMDDLRLVGTSLLDSAWAGQRTWRTLGRPHPPPGPCERTLQVDNLGQVLVSDGDGLTLLRGFSAP
ncbi:MAG: VWA domain-containing protein [SAR324 cluster bacterium]